MTVTAKSTKAEIWEAYQALLAQSQAEVITLPAVKNTAQTVARETAALAEDIGKLGLWAQQRITELVEIYNRPILKAR